MEEIKMRPLSDFDLEGKTILLRLDINSPIDQTTKKIVDENRIIKSLPTLQYLKENHAKVAIIAHQGDTLDYQNLIPMEEHAKRIACLLDTRVTYIDDVCGPSALLAVQNLKPGEIVLLGNLRYLCEEISTFETVVKLSPEEMCETWLVRSLAPTVDLYVNDAFSAAHRSCPSMVAFQEILPTAAGELLMQEYTALTSVLQRAKKPSVFILGGAKISDAFSMMEQVLAKGLADRILTSGVTGCIMLLAQGIELGKTYEKWLGDRDLLSFLEPAKRYLVEYPERFELPSDLAYAEGGKRREISVDMLPRDEALFLDIGRDTVHRYAKIIQTAATIFMNGPAGVYEDPLFDYGTKELWKLVAGSDAYSVIGGGDTCSSASRYIDLEDISYVCTAGGAMVRFIAGKTLPLIEAMEKAYLRHL